MRHFLGSRKDTLKARAPVVGPIPMGSCKMFSHKWDYGDAGARACKRCGSREHFNAIRSEWQPQ